MTLPHPHAQCLTFATYSCSAFLSLGRIAEPSIGDFENFNALRQKGFNFGSVWASVTVKQPFDARPGTETSARQARKGLYEEVSPLHYRSATSGSANDHGFRTHHY